MVSEIGAIPGTSEPAVVPGITTWKPFATDFDPNDLNPTGMLSRIIGRLLDNPYPVLGLLRRLLPIPVFRNWAAMTRYDDVQEVLAQQKVFEVPFGAKMMELNGGPNFMLGMQDGEEYRRQRQLVMQVFKLCDIQRIAARSTDLAQKAVATSNGRLDAIADLVTHIPIELCESYYGIAIPDKPNFARWTLAISADLFANPFDNARYRRAAVAGAERCRAVVTDAIEQAQRTELTKAPDTVLDRFVDLQKQGKGPTDDELLAIMMGIITGFVPTNTMAAGHMLEMLLRRPDFLKPTQAAAEAGDDDLLKRCLFEAMRFKPLNLGPFRRCTADYTVAAGTSRAKKIRKGTNVLPSTQSAMFDPRRVADPKSFNPNRPAADYMLFGHGLHWCVGVFIAEAQITAMFKCLLTKRKLRRAAGADGELRRLGPFPEHLIVEFEP